MYREQASFAPVNLTASSISKGRVIFREGDAADFAFRVRQGWVRQQVITEDGARQIVGFLTTGDIFGIGAHRRTLTAEAVTEVKLTRISLHSLWSPSSFLETGPELLSDMVARYAELAHHATRLIHSSVEERVVRFLGWLAQRQDPDGAGGLATIPMSRFDICDHLGVAPATLSRTLTQLQKDRRLVLYGPRRYRLSRHDRDATFVQHDRVAPHLAWERP